MPFLLFYSWQFAVDLAELSCFTSRGRLASVDWHQLEKLQKQMLNYSECEWPPCDLEN